MKHCMPAEAQCSSFVLIDSVNEYAETVLANVKCRLFLE
jgi:hypothetical protein